MAARDIAFVIRGRSLIGDQPQSVPDIGILENVADLGHFAAGKKHAHGFGMHAESALGGDPGLLNRFGDGKSLLGVGDRGLKQILPRELAVAFVNFRPTFYRARHGEAVNSISWHRLDALLREKFRRQRLRRGTGCIEADQLAGSGFPVDDEEIATQSGFHGLDDGEDGVGGDGGIDCGAALGENLCGCR